MRAQPDVDVILKRFTQPDEVRKMTRGRFELVRIGGMTIGRATYEPAWKWSEHVGKALGKKNTIAGSSATSPMSRSI